MGVPSTHSVSTVVPCMYLAMSAGSVSARQTAAGEASMSTPVEAEYVMAREGSGVGSVRRGHVQVRDDDVHLGDVDDASAHGVGELLAHQSGLLAGELEGLAALEAGDADRAALHAVDDEAEAAEAGQLAEPGEHAAAVGVEQRVHAVGGDARPGDRRAGAVPRGAVAVQDG